MLVPIVYSSLLLAHTFAGRPSELKIIGTTVRYGHDNWNFSKEIDDEDGREVRIMKRMALRARWPEGGFQ